MNKKTRSILLAVLALVVVAGIVLNLKIEPADPKGGGEAGELSCTVEIRCDILTDSAKVTNQAILPYIPEDGVILAAIEVNFSQGESAFDVLQRLCTEQKIPMEFASDSLHGEFVKGIGNIYGGDGGELSGWLYQINGETAEVSCGNYLMQDGDAMLWAFSCDMGADLAADNADNADDADNSDVEDSVNNDADNNDTDNNDTDNNDTDNNDTDNDADNNGNNSGDKTDNAADKANNDNADNSVDNDKANNTADNNEKNNNAENNVVNKEDNNVDNKQPAGQDTPAAPVVQTAKLSCTLEIRCDTITDTSKVTNQAIIPYIPSNGVILATTEVEFSEGESVFDVLQRTCRAKNIHMEFEGNSTYGGAYIQGINYIYEFDAGDLSGWEYKVNGSFPNYGCSSYTLKDGDVIVWCYTCDLGADIGDAYNG